MIIYFERDDWEKKRLAVIVDNTSLMCTSTNPKVSFLKHQSLRNVLRWGLLKAHKMEIQYTTTPVQEAGIRNSDYTMVPKIVAEPDTY